MEILVIGGTGQVGRRVAAGLRERGHGVRVLTRTPEKAERLPEGMTGFVGDLGEPETLRRACAGAQGVFFVTPMAMDETELGLNAVRAAQDAGTERIVYVSVFHLEEAPQVPHFATKVPIQNAIMESGLAWTLLQANHFDQNDAMFREAILGPGVFAEPIGEVGLNRVDARDVGDAAVNALTEEGHAGRAYPLVGPEALTGEDCARIWSEALGRPVQYGGNNLDAFAAQARLMLPGWMVYDLRAMYQYVQEEGMIATDGEIGQTERILGRPARRYADYVRELVPGE